MHHPRSDPLPDRRSLDGSLGGRGFEHRLERWLAEAAVDEAADARRSRHDLRGQAGSTMTLLGVVLDHAERGTTLVVHTGGTHRWRGAVETVGTDFFLLRSDGGRHVAVTSGAVTTVQAERGLAAAPTARRAGVSLTDLLAVLADEQLTVTVHTDRAGEGSAVRGELRAVGVDVVCVVDRDLGEQRFVPTARIAEVVLG